MFHENQKVNFKNDGSKDRFMVRITESIVYDRLYILAAEYSVPVETLINVAVKRLLDDVDFMRDLRIGKIESE